MGVDSPLRYHQAYAHLYLRRLLQQQPLHVAVTDSIIPHVAFALVEQQLSVITYVDQVPAHSSYRIRAQFVYAWRVWAATPVLAQQYQRLLQHSGTQQLRSLPIAGTDRAWWQAQIQAAQAASHQRYADIQTLVAQGIDVPFFAFNDRWRALRSQQQLAVRYLCAQHSGDGVRKVRSGAVDRGQGPLPTGGVALQVHAFYPDMLPELLQRLEVNKSRPDVFISVGSEADKAVAQRCFAAYAAKVVVRVVPNKGRDIGPLLTEFGAELVQHYALIGHVHTKKSLHNMQRDAAANWQHFLWTNTVGKAKNPMMDGILQAFATQPQLGMVYPDDPQVLGWDHNYPFAQRIAQAMGQQLPKEAAFGFPVGTMFWARAEVLAPLLALDFDWSDYPLEPVGKDGTMLHALERLFGFLPQWAGFSTAVTYTAGVSR